MSRRPCAHCQRLWNNPNPGDGRRGGAVSGLLSTGTGDGTVLALHTRDRQDSHLPR